MRVCACVRMSCVLIENIKKNNAPILSSCLCYEAVVRDVADAVVREISGIFESLLDKVLLQKKQDSNAKALDKANHALLADEVYDKIICSLMIQQMHKLVLQLILFCH